MLNSVKYVSLRDLLLGSSITKNQPFRVGIVWFKVLDSLPYLVAAKRSHRFLTFWERELGFLDNVPRFHVGKKTSEGSRCFSFSMIY